MRGRREGKKNAPHNSKFFSTRDEIWRSRVRNGSGKGGSTISCYTINAGDVSVWFLGSISPTHPGRQNQKLQKTPMRNILISASLRVVSVRGGVVGMIRNDKYAAMLLQQALIGQTASPSKRSTSCCAGWSILDDYNAPRTYILNPPTLPPPPPLSLSYTHIFACLPFTVIINPLWRSRISHRWCSLWKLSGATVKIVWEWKRWLSDTFLFRARMVFLYFIPLNSHP